MDLYKGIFDVFSLCTITSSTFSIFQFGGSLADFFCGERFLYISSACAKLSLKGLIRASLNLIYICNIVIIVKCKNIIIYVMDDNNKLE